MNTLSFLDKQKMFIVLNRARTKARKEHPEQFKQIADRLYKAVGIIQHHDYYVSEKALYCPTRSTCNCKDWEFHYAAKRKYTGPCKHMTAEILLERMQLVTFNQIDFLGDMK